jgi:hypothetical protein
VVIASVAIERFESEISDSRSCNAARSYAARSYVARRTARQETRIPKRTTCCAQMRIDQRARPAPCSRKTPRDTAYSLRTATPSPRGLAAHARRVRSMRRGAGRACVRACVTVQ